MKSRLYKSHFCLVAKTVKSMAALRFAGSIVSRIMVAVAITVSCPSLSCAAMIYDLAADFSLVGNPNGVWSYGTTGTTLNGALTPFNFSSSSFGGHTNIHAWAGTETAFGFNYPFVAKNTAGTTQIVGGGFVSVLAGQIISSPSPTGAYSVSRFTAPATGLYQLDAVFQGRDTRGATTDVHVLLNGFSLFSGSVNGFDTPSNQSYSGLHSLMAGDRLDFSVGYGPNQTFNSDSTAIAATVSAVPEPSALALVAASFSVLSWRRRR